MNKIMLVGQDKVNPFPILSVKNFVTFYSCCHYFSKYCIIVYDKFKKLRLAPCFRNCNLRELNSIFLNHSFNIALFEQVVNMLV